jgi:competence protein ComEC
MLYLFVFAIAVFSTSYSPVLPHYFLLFSLLCASLWALYGRYYVIFTLCMGLTIGFVHGTMIVEQQLPNHYEGKVITVTAVIAGLPQQQGNKYRFLASVRQVDDLGDEIFIGQKLQLSWYTGRPIMPITYLAPGQQWQFSVKLRRPRGLVNPAGFDYHAYLLRHQVYATGYVHHQQKPLLLNERCMLAAIDCVRWHIKKRLSDMSSSPALGAIIALAIGDTEQLLPEQWEVFKNTGTIHLLAISGLHIGLSAIIGLWLGRLFVRMSAMFSSSSYLSICIPSLFSVITAGVYSVLAGMSLPTQRALVMVIIYHVSVLLLRRTSPICLLLSALCFIAVIDPLAIYSQGFWLSFLAVTVLLYGFSGRNTVMQSSIKRYIYTSVIAQWVLLVGLLLPSLFWLQGLSVSAPAANIFAVAWVSVVVVPILFCLLILLPLPANPFVDGVFELLEFSVMCLLRVLQWVDQMALPFWYSSMGRPGVIAAILCLFGVLYFLLPRGIGRRSLAIMCFLPLCYPVVRSSDFEMTVMDVGQGTAIVIQTPNHQMVYDTGRSFSDRFNVGEHILTPYLRDKALNRIDLLMVSHRDGDHAGGVQGLLKGIHADQISLGQTLPVQLDHTRVTKCMAGQSWWWDAVHFTVLWPEPRESSPIKATNNNQSCVLLIRYKEKRILLAGDIEKGVERQLLSHPLLRERVDIMLVPHHGSRSSSSVSWVNQLRPRWAVVSAGYKNHYGHPHVLVRQRYEDVGSEWLNTAVAGAIRWQISAQDEWRLTQWRKDFGRYWY